MIVRLALVPLLLILSGCVTYPNITQARSPCVAEPGGWCSFISEAAKEAYPYAIASTNAYQGDDDLYREPVRNLTRLKRMRIDPSDLDKGFDYQIFEQHEPDPDSEGKANLKARIIAFRGTDPSFADIYYGTLKSDQIELAMTYFRREKAKYPQDVPWIATGHSLGGALATEVSLQYPEVKAWSFNLSPFYRGHALANAGQRTVISERGEVLEGFRKNKPASARNVFVINCLPQKKRFTKHKVRTLGDCLIWIAAYHDKTAWKIIQDNQNSKPPIVKPPVECGPEDKIHPGTDWVPGELCVHVARAPKGD